MSLAAIATAPPDLATTLMALPVELRQTLRRARDLRPARGERLALGRSELDRMLGGGLPYGAITEARGHVGSGRFATVLASLGSITSRGELAALVDLGDGFDPQIAAASGITLERLLWIRPRHLREAVAAAEIAICGGFALVALDLGLPPVLRGGRVDSSVWVRLARTAARERSVVLVATTWPLDSPAAELVLTFTRRPARWIGRAMPLLAGVEGEVRIERQRGAREGDRVAIGWKLAEGQ